jgi:hypothetical protein
MVSHGGSKQAPSEAGEVRFGIAGCGIRIADFEGEIKKFLYRTSHLPHRLILTVFEVTWSEREE